MQELSIIEVLQLKIRQEEETYAAALEKNETSRAKKIQIEEKIRQLESALQYLQGIYDSDSRLQD